MSVVCLAKRLLWVADDLTGIRLMCHAVKGLEECAQYTLTSSVT